MSAVSTQTQVAARDDDVVRGPLQTHDAERRGHVRVVGAGNPFVTRGVQNERFVVRLLLMAIAGVVPVLRWVCVCVCICNRSVPIDALRVGLQIVQYFLPKGMAIPVVGPGQLQGRVSKIVLVVNGRRVGRDQGPYDHGRGVAAVTGQMERIITAGILRADPSFAVLRLEPSANARPVFLHDLVVEFRVRESHAVF